MNPTIKDVARKANVSLGTVSRYLNNKGVLDENRERIEGAISELGYKINTLAKGLRNNKTMTVGVIVHCLGDYFASDIIQEIEEYYNKLQYSVIICNSKNDPELEKKKVRFLMEKYVDGIIIVPSYDGGRINYHLFQEVQDRGIPMVFIDQNIDKIECDKVLVDNINGAYLAVEELVKSGHRKIAVVNGPMESTTSVERFTGYKRVFKDYGIEIDERLIIGTLYNPMEAYEKVNSFLDKNIEFTAVFSTNMNCSKALIKAFHNRHIKIPEHVSFIGIDYLEINEYFDNPLSVVRQPVCEIGLKAAEILYKRIQNSEGVYQTIRLKTQLQLTGSIKNIL